MLCRILAILEIVVALGLCAGLFAQGLTTTATKDDWEEINFEFNSSILSDGYPSLLRLADLLTQHPDYRVRVEGHTDYVGSDGYNDKLALARAETVKSFLVKNGVKPDQVTTSGQGKRDPEVDNKTSEGRFINRRVTLTVTDGQGKTVSAGGVGEVVKALSAAEMSCCQDVLKKLDELDKNAALLRDLAAQNAQLKQDLAGLRQDAAALKLSEAAIQQQVAGLPRPPERAELAQMMEETAQKALEAARPKRFELLDLNLGPDTTRNLSVTGKARFFTPFGDGHALQAQGEYLRYADRQEGQFDLGLIDRRAGFQAGLFASFKRVHLKDYTAGGTLGQAALSLDYVFSRGRIGAFGTKSFLDEPVIGRVLLGGNLFRETYLRVVDQVGGSAQVGLHRNAYVEGNLGMLFRKGGDNRPGGTVRFVQPLSQHVAFTVEAGLNETLIGQNDSGRVVFGLQFGNWIRPKEYAGLKSPVPVDVPRIRYETLTRIVRVGNDPPVADAGPDQIGVAAGVITLDGSASYDPDGDPITYQWSQVSGPAVTITGAKSAQASFTAADAQSYVFRLVVTDSLGATGQARATVTTAAATPPVEIIRFTAEPSPINAGQSTTLVWEVRNADEVTISGFGNVDPKVGTRTVTLSETTTYTLTAKNSVSEATAAVTIQVTPTPPEPPSNHAPVADAGPNQTTSAHQFHLNGSASYDPDGDPITYSWRVAGTKPATLLGADTATPIATPMQNYGDYIFELTVTDSKGARSTATTTVTFMDP